jgi:hypothetical protein
MSNDYTSHLKVSVVKEFKKIGNPHLKKKVEEKVNNLQALEYEEQDKMVIYSYDIF